MDATIVCGFPSSTTFGTPGTQAVVDPTFNALRVNPKPTDYAPGVGGGGLHGSVAVATGAFTGAGAGGIVFLFRNTGVPSTLLIVKRVIISAVVTTAFTTGQAIDFDIVRMFAWSAADTGGTTFTVSTGGNKLRTSMGTSAAQVEFATTAALTGGTGTADTNAFGYAVVPQSPVNTVGVAGQVDLYNENMNGAHPAVFAAQEGFRVRAVTAMGAAGVIKVYMTVLWVEAPGY